MGPEKWLTKSDIDPMFQRDIELFRREFIRTTDPQCVNEFERNLASLKVYGVYQNTDKNTYGAQKVECVRIKVKRPGLKIPINLYDITKNNIEDMSLSQYFCELSEHFAPKETDAEDFLRLILNALYFLNKKKRPAQLIKSVVELRMMCISGYMPDLICCTFCKCYETEKMYFLPYSGKLVCSDCISKSDVHSTEIPRSVVTAMRHCVYSEFNRLFNFKLSSDGMELLERCSEEYLLCISEHNFRTLAFYKNIK